MEPLDKLKAVPKETAFDRIFAWYVDENSIQLTEAETERKDRWEKCWYILCNNRSLQQTVNIVQRLYRGKVSRATVYNDVKFATKLFGEIAKPSKDAQRFILTEYSQRIYQIAMKKDPPDLDQANKAIANMVKLGALDKDDPDMPDFNKIQQHIFNFTLPEEILHFIKTLASKGAIDLSKIRSDEYKAIDITPIQQNDTPGQETGA